MGWGRDWDVMERDCVVREMGLDFCRGGVGLF